MPYLRSPIFRSKLVTQEAYEKIAHFTFKEARRLKYPIYDILLTELREENCRKTEEYFVCLVHREQNLYKQQIIGDLMYEDRGLLLLIFENAKMAEKAAKLKSFGGMPACLEILYRILVILLPHAKKFDWLLTAFYKIFINIAESHKADDLKCFEIKSKLFCSYGIYLGQKSNKLDKSIEYYEKSLELCRGELWPITDIYRSPREFKSLHEFVAVKLAATLIEHAKVARGSKWNFGIKLCQRAIVALAEVKAYDTRVLICEALLVQIKIYIENYRFRQAMDIIKLTEKQIGKDIGVDFVSVTCELYLYKGQCFQLQREPGKALANFKLSHQLGQKYNRKFYVGKSLLYIGKLYEQYPDTIMKAKESFEEAHVIFKELQNNTFRDRAIYALARIMWKEHFPEFMKILKRSDDYCQLHKLRKWKEQCKPFWKEKRISEELKSEQSASQLDDDVSIGYDYNAEENDISLSNESIFMDTEDDTVRVQRLTQHYLDMSEIQCLFDE